MASKSFISNTSYERFEKEILNILKTDPEHAIRFEKGFLFHSYRHGADFRAYDIHWKPERGEIVLVGAHRWDSEQKDRRPLDSDSAASTRVWRDVVKTTVDTRVELPMSEVYADMNRQYLEARSGERKVRDGSYLINKSKKAVLDKYIGQSFRALEPLARRGVLHFDDFIDRFDTESFMHDIRQPESLRIDEKGKYVLMDKAGKPIDLFDAVFPDVMKYHDYLQLGRNNFRNARRAFAAAKDKTVSPDGLRRSYSEHDEKMGDIVGLCAVYGHYPLRVVHGVANSMTVDFKRVFDDDIHSQDAIDRMMKASRQNGLAFGKFDNSLGM